MFNFPHSGALKVDNYRYVCLYSFFLREMKYGWITQREGSLKCPLEQLSSSLILGKFSWWTVKAMNTGFHPKMLPRLKSCIPLQLKELRTWLASMKCSKREMDYFRAPVLNQCLSVLLVIGICTKIKPL